ncbi:MAG TPA: DUF1285 domain-containing protein [Stellaceae bacterium]|nr:DUF1285 domain-containing protein [Stellaceae bacterium]
MTSDADDEPGLARIGAAVAAPPDSARPRDCGHFEIRIDRNGSWFYRGTPINRMSLARLFSTVLQRDAAGAYWLITPAECGRITVEDAPFLAVELERRGGARDQVLIFHTNLGDSVSLDAAHPLRIEIEPSNRGPRPYILVRNGLEARVVRPVFYELVELAGEERVGQTTRFGVWSKGTFFPLDQATDGG